MRLHYLRQVNFYRLVILRGHVRTVPGNMLVKFEVCRFNRFKVTVLELLAFNNQIFKGSRDFGHAPFRKIFKGYARTVTGNMLVKFEL